MPLSFTRTLSHQVIGSQPMNKRGVSLIEVMVAMALFTTAVAVLTQGYVDSITALESVKTGDPRIADIRFIQDYVYDIESRDDFQSFAEVPSANSGNIRFEAQLDTTDITDVFKVSLKLDFLDKKDEPQWRYWEETRYLYRPEWTEDSERQAAMEAKREAIEDLIKARAPKPS